MSNPHVTILVLISLGGVLPAQTKKPDFSGRWEMNPAKSTSGRMPAPNRLVEVIEHKESSLVISNTTEDARGTITSYMKLTIDNRENINVINGNEFRSKTRWEGDKLITQVTGDRGLSMTEVRSLSADGKTQMVEMYMGEVRGDPQIRRLLERKADR